MQHMSGVLHLAVAYATECDQSELLTYILKEYLSTYHSGRLMTFSRTQCVIIEL